MVAAPIVYLFVVLKAATPTSPVPFQEIYRTGDSKACEETKASWNTKLAPTKFECIPVPAALKEDRD